MKKRLNSDALMQEFQEGSAFFRKTPGAVPSPLAESDTTTQGISPSLTLEPASLTDTVIPRHHDTSLDTTVSRYQTALPVEGSSTPTSANTLVERTRRAVKHLGKEAATHRFTADEKKALKKIEHEYALKGVRTSENEITRIAINYVMEEYRQQKEASILAQVLELLNN